MQLRIHLGQNAIPNGVQLADDLKLGTLVVAGHCALWNYYLNIESSMECSVRCKSTNTLRWRKIAGWTGCHVVDAIVGLDGVHDLGEYEAKQEKLFTHKLLNQKAGI